MQYFNMNIEDEVERTRRVVDAPAGIEYSFQVSVPEDGWAGRILVRVEDSTGQMHIGGDLPNDPGLAEHVVAEVGRRAQTMWRGTR